ncbi:MAG: cadherin-like beta sandwich domain-containing protein, partial [Chloroflexi bacterium]|nr:cadherin-like beta sandwich domain-containing protein [Chloroflexota bacterium]
LTATKAGSAGGSYTALTLSPAFSASTTSYTATVANTVTHVKLTPAVNESGATVKAGMGNGLTAVASGSAGAAIALSVGANALEVEVTAADGSTKKTYTVTVTRRGSSDATLSGLTATKAGSAGGSYTALTLSPAFSASTTSYTATVANTVTHVKLTPAVNESGAAVKAGMGNGLAAVASGSAGGAIALSVGANALKVEVTAQDGTTKKTYTVTVTRRGSSDATLSGLTATKAESAGGSYSALDIGAFAAGTTSYSATVPYATTHVKLTPTVKHSGAAVKAGMENGLTAVASGSAGAAIALSVGANALEVEVTAQDGTTKKTYRVTVTREAARPLTASFENVAQEHDGRAAFTLDVRFSEAPGGVAPSAASFRVAYGRVAGVERVSAGLWRVRVQPKNWKDVKVALAPPSDCAAAGAVCASGGRALSNALTATIGGPVRVRVEGARQSREARAREGKDEALEFAVTLNRAAAHEVSVDYATEDDTATAGADYTAVSGTLVFAAGETAKTVSLPVLDDAVDEGKEVMRLKLSNPRGAYLRSIRRQARGIIHNDDPLQRAWLARFGRTAAGHVSEAIGGRLRGEPGRRVVLGGQEL